MRERVKHTSRRPEGVRIAKRATEKMRETERQRKWEGERGKHTSRRPEGVRTATTPMPLSSVHRDDT